MPNKLIGFIGQGWIGKNYADDFEKRGYEVIRYALEEPYVDNKEKIKDCDIVFIAVPTPTTINGFDDSIVRKAIKLVGEKKIAVIKSTLLPGTTESIQSENPGIFVLHSPEFLREVSAAQDAANPVRNIIGIPVDNEEYRSAASKVLEVLPKASMDMICKSKDAELVKYAGNCFLYLKVVFMNMLHDLSGSLNCDWNTVRDLVSADPRIGRSHMEPIHKSGRGAGGHCFIKDMAAFASMYAKNVGDESGAAFLETAENKNIELLLKSGKDLDLLRGVYGEEILNFNKEHEHEDFTGCGCGHHH